MQATLRRCSQSIAKRASIQDHLSRIPKSGPVSNEPVQLNAWIKSIRRQKHVAFLNLSDGSNPESIQAVIPNSLLESSGDAINAALQTGASVSLTGRLTEKQGGRANAAREASGLLPTRAVELQVDNIAIVGECDGGSYPIQKKDHTAPFLRRNAHLRARTSLISTTLRVRDTMTRSCYSYFHEQGYINTTMPIITSSDCEGAGEVFTVMHGPAGKEKPFWGDSSSYLTVSGQLHLEALTIGGGLGKTWHLGPCFRAERSDTNRHLNEFWMCEAELAWTESLEDVMQVVEGLVRRIAKQVLQENVEAMKLATPQGRWVCEGLDSFKEPWKRMSYDEAIEELVQEAKNNSELFQHQPDYDVGLRSEHERFLAEKYGPTFVTDYPAVQKPFYMRLNEGGKAKVPTVACFDLLVPKVGEVVGGSLREERLDKLTKVMTERGMNLENYEWYLDLRRYGSVPHGGFGLGWERLVSWLCGIDNVRECIPFPRGTEASRF